MLERSSSALSSGAFRIAATALAVVMLAATAAALALFRQSEAALTSHVLDALHQDAALIEREVRDGGVDAARRAVDLRASGIGAGLYFLADETGRKLAGNLNQLPPEIADKPAGGVFSYSVDASRTAGDGHIAVALRAQLPTANLMLVVGRDIDTEQRLLARMRWLALLGMGLLALTGIAGGYALSRNIVSRVEAVNRTAHAIMAGTLSQRIPVGAGGDEIDALSINLNRMLDRIEQLMSGLREVSDNIAHDLKTPLNRLRNRAEAALRDGRGADAYREGLERTIEEADDLIKTFNALLLIARLEAGALEGTTEIVDVGGLVSDLAELYEPVAEEAGLMIELSVGKAAPIEINRHLVGQAVANLVDNAIKYATVSRSADNQEAPRAATRIVIAVEAVADGVAISVADDGPGIPAADRERVLRRFVRLEQSRSRPGTGLGLSLVAAVARLHAGSVRLEDNAPGLRVVLTLPAQGHSLITQARGAVLAQVENS